MLLPDKDGIACDFCGTSYKEQFKYYSTNATKFQVQRRKDKVLVKSPPQKVDFNRDMCEVCYDGLLDQVKANVAPAKRNAIKCDLSKTYKSENFEYYLILFDFINVDKNATKGVQVERNVMDLNVIIGFDHLLKKLEVTRKKIQKQGMWT
jgi:hypothetical protein